MALQVRDGRVRLMLPVGIDLSQALSFVLGKRDWILRHQAKQQDLDDDRTALMHQLHHRHQLPWQGDILDLRPGPRFAVNGQTMALPRGCFDNGVLNYRQLVPALRAGAGDMLVKRTFAVAARMGVQPVAVSVRLYRRRWGCCDGWGRIQLHWPLVHVPAPLIDYVIIHELCHLNEMNHSPAFWKHVAQWCPDWKTRRTALHDHSHWLDFWQSAVKG
jgi:predicted metal-dependent hydrolase